MASDERDKLAAEMESIRGQGLQTVEQLSRDVTRMADWREYIRASPLPFVIGAAVAGYVLVPSRRVAARLPPNFSNTSPELLPTAKVHQSSVSSIVGKLRIAAMAYAGRWIRTAVSDFVRQQVRSIVEHRDDPTERPPRTHAQSNGSTRRD